MVLPLDVLPRFESAIEKGAEAPFSTRDRGFTCRKPFHDRHGCPWLWHRLRSCTHRSWSSRMTWNLHSGKPWIWCLPKLFHLRRRQQAPQMRQLSQQKWLQAWLQALQRQVRPLLRELWQLARSPLQLGRASAQKRTLHRKDQRRW